MSITHIRNTIVHKIGTPEINALLDEAEALSRELGMGLEEFKVAEAADGSCMFAEHPNRLFDGTPAVPVTAEVIAVLLDPKVRLAALAVVRHFAPKIIESDGW